MSEYSQAKIVLIVLVMCLIPLEVEAARTRTRNPRTRDPENKRVIRAEERKKKIKDGQKEVRARKLEKKEIEREKQRQEVLMTWDSNLPTPQYDKEFKERKQIDALGPNGKAYWIMARKYEILMQMPKYGTRKRQEYDYKRDLKRFPKFCEIVKESSEYKENIMRILNHPARTTHKWVVLREWGFPRGLFGPEMLTSGGEWVNWNIFIWSTDDEISERELYPTNHERWEYEVGENSEYYYFVDDKLITHSELPSYKGKTTPVQIAVETIRKWKDRVIQDGIVRIGMTEEEVIRACCPACRSPVVWSHLSSSLTYQLILKRC